MTNPAQKVPVLGANYLPRNPASDDLKERAAGEPVSFFDPKGDSGLFEKLQVLTDAMAKKTPMATTPTHLKYQCRICQKEHLQPVLQDAPEKTPVPRCCGRDRDMAFKGHHNDSKGSDNDKAER